MGQKSGGNMSTMMNQFKNPFSQNNFTINNLAPSKAKISQKDKKDKRKSQKLARKKNKKR
ncbi:hypothetical protein D3C83_250590 [compost metagenome]